MGRIIFLRYGAAMLNPRSRSGNSQSRNWRGSVEINPGRLLLAGLSPNESPNNPPQQS
jgi:hypothetical protein